MRSILHEESSTLFAQIVHAAVASPPVLVSCIGSIAYKAYKIACE
jgi:hypothetical protein